MRKRAKERERASEKDTAKIFMHERFANNVITSKSIVRCVRRHSLGLFENQIENLNLIYLSDFSVKWPYNDQFDFEDREKSTTKLQIDAKAK